LCFRTTPFDNLEKETVQSSERYLDFKVSLFCLIPQNYRVSIKSLPDYKQMFTWTCWNFTLHLRRVSTVDNFPTRWCNSTLGYTCSSVFGCNISKQVDWARWSDNLATTIAGITTLDFFLLGYVRDKVFSTPVPDITNLTARITYAFATITEDTLANTWRETEYRLDVLRATKGAHVEVY